MTDLVGELTLTNIQPIFLTGVEPRNYIQLQRLLELPRTRTLIVHGKHNRPGLVQMELPTRAVPTLAGADWVPT